MGGFCLVLGSPPAGRERAALAAAAAMPERGSTIQEVVCVPGVSVAAATVAWQESLNGGSIGRFGDVIVAADATLYYRDALRHSLARAGIKPESLGAGDLIAAAVAAWDTEAPNFLEGDFAYVAIRLSSRSGHAARDPVGTRPVFFTRWPGGVAVASSPQAMVSAGLAPDSLNLDWITELCAGWVSVGSETAYRDVAALRQGERLRIAPDFVPRAETWWKPPQFTENGRSDLGFDEAAIELRRLIVDAVRERIDPAGHTFVSLSGGRDSTAVYAAGRHVAGENVRSISLSYPVGDMGRENDTILDVLEQCGGVARWIDTARLTLLPADAAEMGIRPDAFAHPYEVSTREIADAARGAGARVVLNGLGGDTLFHAEVSFLADLALSGRWRTFVREWRLMGGKADPRAFMRWALLPRLGPAGRSFVAALRGGRPLRDVWESPLPSWIVAGADVQSRFSWRAWNEPVRLLGPNGAADRERRLILLGPFAGRVVPEYSRISLARGVEQRSPLYDRRIIEFAASRPRAERRTGNDYKRLLRASMVGWLPPSVTQARTNATGFTGGYFRSTAGRELPQLVANFGDTLLVSELGLVLASEYRAEVRRLAERGDHPQLPALVFTTLTELWLRSRA